MNNQLVLTSLGIYLGILIVIGFIANRKRKSESTKDFYLADKGFGTLVLLLTMYATQYSGNSLLGITGQVFRGGMIMIVGVGVLTSFVIFALSYAPQLYRLSRKIDFITPGDYLDYRYQSPRLSLFINGIIIVVALSFLLGQLIAMGRISESLTNGEIPYWAGVVFLAIIVVIYESLGGMLAVAWTDVAQGLMLLIGLTGLLFIAIPNTDALANATLWIMENQPQKVEMPTLQFILFGLSTIFVMGVGASVYPQTIQRIYAARNTKVIKRAFSIMVFMPIFTIFILFLLGVMSIPQFADLTGAKADAILPMYMTTLAENSQTAYYLMIVVIVGILAALMSTADSILLSMSSILAIDIFGKTNKKHLDDTELTRLGKRISVILMFVLVIFAMIPDLVIYRILETKFTLASQTGPAFILGLTYPNLQANTVIKGMIIGFVITAVLTIAIFVFLPAKAASMATIVAAAIGLIFNFLICYLGRGVSSA